MTMAQMKWSRDPAQVRALATEKCRAPDCTPGANECEAKDPKCAPCFARWAMERVTTLRMVPR